MRVYAKPGFRMARQILGDLLLVAWIAAWAWGARFAHDAVAQLAVPARKSGNLAADLGAQMRSAQGELAQVPGVGDQLGQPFGSLSGGLEQLSELGHQQVEQVQHLATVTGWICFLVPVVMSLVIWLPGRFRFVRHATLARRFVDADEDMSLFALRGMANLPMDVIARITPDPVGQWRAGNKDVIRALAAKELERTGLDMPAPVRSK